MRRSSCLHDLIGAIAAILNSIAKVLTSICQRESSKPETNIPVYSSQIKTTNFHRLPYNLLSKEGVCASISIIEKIAMWSVCRATTVFVWHADLKKYTEFEFWIILFSVDQALIFDLVITSDPKKILAMKETFNSDVITQRTFFRYFLRNMTWIKSIQIKK